MKLNPLASRQIAYFESRRELEGVEKKSLSNPDDIRDWVEQSFERTRREDEGPDDLDPLPGRVLQKGQGRSLEAAFQVDGEQQHLERCESKRGEQRFTRVHKTPVAIEAFWSFSHPDYPQLLECFRIDLKHPEASFYQRLELGA